MKRRLAEESAGTVVPLTSHKWRIYHGLDAVLVCWLGLVTTSVASARLCAEEVAMDKLSVPPFFARLSENTYPVDLDIARHKMVIPRNYIGSAWFDDGSLALQLFTIYPSFEGVTLDNFKEIRFSVGKKTPNVVQITRLTEFAAGRPFKASVSRAAREFGMKTDVDGLVMVKEGFDNWQILARNGYSYYVGKLDVPENDVIITCSEEIMNLRNCNVDMELANNLIFQYEFYFSQLKNWKLIHKGLMTLLTGFLRS